MLSEQDAPVCYGLLAAVEVAVMCLCLRMHGQGLLSLSIWSPDARMPLCVQVQSNALAALEALDTEVAEDILSSGCVTGDRINGLCDGETGKW